MPLIVLVHLDDELDVMVAFFTAVADVSIAQIGDCKYSMIVVN